MSGSEIEPCNCSTVRDIIKRTEIAFCYMSQKKKTFVRASAAIRCTSTIQDIV
jgi:hypothetical protein